MKEGKLEGALGGGGVRVSGNKKERGMIGYDIC